MGHEITYDSPDPKVNHAKALDDIKFYLGAKKYKELTNLLKEEIAKGLTRDQVVMSMVMCGIQGFPAQAWATECGCPTKPKKLNHDEIVHLLLNAQVINPNTKTGVHHDHIKMYLELRPAKLDVNDRVTDFKNWLRGDYS